MPKSWGHQLVILPEWRRTVPSYDDKGVWGRRRRKCATARCEEVAEFDTRYHYVTGRGGKTGNARRSACRHHAERFAEKHGLEMPELGEGGG